MGLDDLIAWGGMLAFVAGATAPVAAGAVQGYRDEQAQRKAALTQPRTYLPPIASGIGAMTIPVAVDSLIAAFFGEGLRMEGRSMAQFALYGTLYGVVAQTIAYQIGKYRAKSRE
jgi:hypothetical protein